jgi:hypothetical protein
MNALMGLLVSAGAAAAVVPTALGLLHTAERTVTTTELQLVTRNAYQFAIQRDAFDVAPEDLARATAFSEYRPADWANKPVFDAATNRVYAATRGESCQALELVPRTAPDLSTTAVAVEIVDRPLDECERVRGSSAP